MAQDKYTSSVRAEAPTELQATDIKYAIQSSQALEARLDRLSGFIYKDLEKEAERMGLRYGVTNKPSLEQIAKALEKGEDPNQVFHKEGTVFGDAAHKVQAEIFRQDLEYDFVNELQKINQAIEAGAEVDHTTLAADLQAKIDSQAKILSTIDPEQMAKFRAGMTLKGNAVYNNALTQNVIRINAANVNKAENAIKQYGNDLVDLLKSTDGNVIDAYTLLMPDKNRIAALADRVPSKKLELMQAFDKERLSASKRVITDFLTDNVDHVPLGSTVLLELQNGNLGKMTNLWNTLDNATKESLQKDIIANITNRNAYNKAIDEQKEFDNQAKISEAYIQLFNGKLSASDAIVKLTDLKGYLSAEEVKAIIAPQPSTNDTIVNTVQLNRKIVIGEAGFNDIIVALNKKDITPSDAKTLSDAYNTKLQAATVGLNNIKKAMGVTSFNDLAIIPRYKQEAIDSLSQQLLFKAKDALDKGIKFDDVAEADALIRNWQSSRNTEAVTKSLGTLNDTLKLNLTEETYNKLWQGNRDATIKYLRKQYNLDLENAKDMADAIEKLNGILQ